MESGTINKVLLETDIRTDLDAFELVRKYLLTQKDRSVGIQIGKCRYRGYSFSKISKRFDEISDELKSVYGDEYYRSYRWDLEKVLEILDQNEEFSEYDSMCAIGCLIDDKFYSPYIEDNPASSLMITEVLQISNPNWKMSEGTSYMLTKLQNLHDSIPIENWEETFLSMDLSFDKDGDYIPSEEEQLESYVL